MNVNATPSFMDRILASLREIVRAEVPSLTYSGIWEYQVTNVRTDASGVVSIDGTPTSSIPLPGIVNIPIRPSMGGSATSPVSGSKVVVGFINQDPTRPFVLTMDSTAPSSVSITTAELQVFSPAVNLAASYPTTAATVIRNGDTVTIGSTVGVVILTPAPTNSKVKA